MHRALTETIKRNFNTDGLPLKDWVQVGAGSEQGRLERKTRWRARLPAVPACSFPLLTQPAMHLASSCLVSIPAGPDKEGGAAA